jgi:hypothetical protein
LFVIPWDVALQRKSVKPAGSAQAIEFHRKCPEIAKEFTLCEGAFGAQTLYMTGRMLNNGKCATAIRQAAD